MSICPRARCMQFAVMAFQTNSIHIYFSSSKQYIKPFFTELNVTAKEVSEANEIEISVNESGEY